VHYLRFKARGVPRRLLHEVNSLVAWDDNSRPRLRVGAKDMERVDFYARLERILRDYIEHSGRNWLFPVAIDEDRWRLGSYYIVDWVLQSEGDPFTAADLLRQGEDAEFDPLLRVSPRNVEGLLDHLAQHQILEVLREMNATATVYGDVAESSEKVFCLAEDIRKLLYGFAAQHESERAAREAALAAAGRPMDFAQPVTSAFVSRAAPASPSPPTGTFASSEAGPPADVVLLPPARVIAGRYQLGELIGQGGLSSVYKGQDLVTSRPVVVKLLRPTLRDDAVAMARFRREADIAKRLTHPQIVRTFDVLEGPEHPALITEWLNGPNLEAMVRDEGPIPSVQVAAIGQILASALDYVAGEQVVRLDLKPSNIVMADRGPVITDLGIAVHVGTGVTQITMAGQFIGTPAFMAPEVIEGLEPDHRADIYALGLVLYFCLTGKNPWADLSDPMAVMRAVVNEQIDLSGLPVSAEFRAALGQAIARKPGDRFPSAAAFQHVLLRTPELRSITPETGPQDDITPQPALAANDDPIR
jgi:serine/threonine-protein kinase